MESSTDDVPAGHLSLLLRPFPLDRFLATTATRILERTGAHRVLILLDREGEPVVASSSGSRPRDLLEEDEIRALRPLLEESIATNRPLSITDSLKTSSDRNCLVLAGFGLRSVHIIPLERTGWIAAYRSDATPLKPAPQDDITALLRLGVEISRLREARSHDEISGSLSHALLLSRLSEEVHRASRSASPLSLLLLDIDAFAKDPRPEVLRGVAKAIGSALRPIDLFARHVPRTDDLEEGMNGDEFYVLLPDTDREEAIRMALRIRKTLTSDTGLTASFGIATLPTDADSGESLLITTRDALALAKKRGDCVCDLRGPVTELPASAPSTPVQLTREGRVLEELLRRIFTIETDLSIQLDLAAVLLATSAQAGRSMLVALDSEGGWLSIGRHAIREEEEQPLNALLRMAIARGEPVRTNDAPGIAVPILAGGQGVGIAYIEGTGTSLSPHQVSTLVSVASRIGPALQQSVRFQRQREEIHRRREILDKAVAEIRTKYDFSAIAGEGTKLMETLQLVAQGAQTDAPVLVLGESGTGKELVARAIHANSARRKGPFVVLNCAALPATLLESELFGHIRGAFTGADRDRAGRFESANHGTLFLDEITEMPVETQAKLLRAIQFGEIQHLGSDSLVRVDTRVVAATNRDLEKEVREKRFREDLFFRINVFQIEVPPLRERLEDLPSITQFVLKRISEELGRPIEVEPAVLDALRRYSFPGNVRELENILRRGAALAAGNTITPRDLPAPVRGLPDSAAPTAVARTAEELAELKRQGLTELNDRLDRSFIHAALTRTRGNVSEAARLTKINRTSLQKMLARYAIDPASFKKP